MLKIWKRTWKERDPSYKSQSERESDQDGSVGGPSSSAPSLDVVEAAPPSEAVLPSALSSGSSGPKRPKSSLEHVDRPSKKSRTNDPSLPSSLGKHRPEVLEQFKDKSLAPYPAADFTDQVVDCAIRENTIVVLPQLASAVSIVVQFLKWAIGFERNRTHPEVIRHRIALMVVHDELAVEEYRARIGAENNDIIVESCLESAHGSDGDPWPRMLRGDLVIVPSTLLHSSLSHGTLAMIHLHALIIIDAQNILHQDSLAPIPIVQVMKGFYRVTDPLSRPRILAFANPPVDRGLRFDTGMLDLETTLDAKVFGLSWERRAEILALYDRPNEVVVIYEPPPNPAYTKLFQQLQQLDPSETTFQRDFKASRHALVEVGSCASDLIWRRALTVIDASVPPWYEDSDSELGNYGSTAYIRCRIRDVVRDWDFTMPNLDSSSRGFNFTDKFLRLVQVLKSCEPYGEAFRGIVFVRRRAIALVMVDIIRILNEQLGFLRPCAVIGHGPSAKIEHQQGVFHGFEIGTYNVLIATKSTEDLDLPRASIIIRFDLFESQLSNAYVRARTCGHQSHLVYMVERGNVSHRRILAQITQADADMLRWTASLRNTLQSSFPPPALKETNTPYHSESEDDDQTEAFILDPTTSGRIYLQDATTVLYRFASILRRKGEKAKFEKALFEFHQEQTELDELRTYVCTVLLPGTPFHRISGLPSMSMAEARRSACFNACKELASAGLLDRLFPLSSDLKARHSSLVNSHSSSQHPPHNKSVGTRRYPCKQPDFWTNAGTTPFKSLYPTIISTDKLDDAMQPHAPILILTRQPLPDLATFKLFFSGVPTSIWFQRGAAFQVNDAQLRDIYLYTVRVCRIISNKPYMCSLANMVYFFAPLSAGWTPPKIVKGGDWVFANVVDHIPWDLVSRAASEYVVPLKTSSPDEIAKDIEDAVIQDRWVEFTRRYDAVRLRHDLTPLSRPLDSPREAGYESLVDFCKARRKGFEGLQDYSQPIIEVSKVPALLNHLNPTSRPLLASARSPARYLIPELCAKFTIPASTLRTALLLPSITRKIGDLLLVKELNAKFFDHAVSEQYLHMAICAPSAGVEYDYERLELLGDAFLKYLSTIYVFVMNPVYNEGALHAARQQLISNKSLLQNASRAGLPAYIQSKPFAVKLWHPPNFHLGQSFQDVPLVDISRVPDDNNRDPSLHPISSGPSMASEVRTAETSVQGQKSKKKKKKPQDNTQWLGDKAVADVAEAIIGAAYMTGGRETALKATKALNVPISNIDQWSDFGRRALAPSPSVTAKLRSGSIQAVEAIIGHKFTHPHLLAQALTHPSIHGSDSTSYERLEFVGDAILDFMVIRYIFDRYQQLSPGALTLLKGAMVSNSALAAVCVWSGLHGHFLYESHNLAISIQEYANLLKINQEAEYRAAEQEGRPPGQYWLEIEPPKALSDVVESIAGATYISDGFMPVGAEALFTNVLKPFYNKHITLKTLSHHPTKILFELFQAQGCQQFEIIKEKENNITRCHVLVHQVILASAEDVTPTVAARRTSLFALDALEGDAEFLTRTCDCRANSQAKKGKNKAFEQILLDLEEEQQDIITVENVLTAADRSIEPLSEEASELEEGMILE